MAESSVNRRDPDLEYFRWAESAASQAFEAGASKADIAFGDWGKGWPARRRRAASDAVSMLDKSLAALARAESMDGLPEAEFLMDEPSNPGGPDSCCGALAIGSVRAPFWPIERYLVPRGLQGEEEPVDAPPEPGSPDLKPHRSKVAATLLFRMAAELMIARKAAKAAFMAWARQAAAEARSGAGPWRSAHARYERIELDGCSEAAAAEAPAKRARL